MTIGPVPDGGGLTGKVHANAALSKVADKAAALKAAAVAAGALGERVDTWGRTGQVGKKPKKPWKPAQMFTRDKASMNNSEVATLDPFFHRVAVPYTIGAADHTLTLEYQHRSALQGYVSQVTDTADNSRMGGLSMYSGFSSPHKAGYGSSHDPVKGNLLAETFKAGPKGTDAYTKLAGEGARWVCVRDNVAKLHDDSVFYCADPTNGANVLTVRFNELWLSWADRFKKKYNISNDEVVRALKAGTLGGPEPRTDIRPATDVNLEA